MIFNATVATDVLDRDPLGRKQPRDQVTAVATARILLTTEDCYPKVGQAEPNPLQAGLERRARAEPIVVDAALMVVEPRVARATAELVAQSQVANIAGDQRLCFLQRHLTVTDLLMEIIFDHIFLVETGVRISQFGPQIGDVI